ncbi:MAG TPA: prepilin peptidase [Candidatus Paceibacterota bacterium]
MLSIGVIGFALLGGVLASFLGVVAERVHTGQSWVRDRSRCNSCSEPLDWRDLMPVLSYVTTLGRARCCGARLPGTYVASELLLGLVFALAYLKLGFGVPLPAFLLAMLALAFIVLYDLRHTVVPVAASTLLMFLSLGFAWLSARAVPEFGLALSVAGFVGLFFFLFYALSRGRAMGLGDTPVALSLALLVGPYLALPGLLFSFWIGAIVGIAILVGRPKGHRMGIEVPFVPFLAAGFLLAYFTQWNPLLLPL